MSLATTGFFDNYTKMQRRIPVSVWWVARGLVLTFAAIIVVLLFAKPDLGKLLFWGLAIPVVPLVLVIAPGLWRQVCPMALFNQLPRTFGFGLEKTLPEGLRKAAFAIAIACFVGFVAIRWPLLNHSPVIAGCGILLAFALAFIGGFVFKGRSGWCGTFCALGPIQRVYGQAPGIVVPNGYCSTCVGCQKNCYDFNPRAAIFSDVYDEDPRYAGQRRLFMGILPGLIIGYFAQDTNPAYGEGWRFALLLTSCCASAGLYGLLSAFLPLNGYRISAFFSAVALALFYWWSGPTLVNTFGILADFKPPAMALIVSQLIGLTGALVLLFNGLLSERRYAAARSAKDKPTEGTLPKIQAGLSDRKSVV